MAKQRTSWRKQGQTAPTVEYDDSTVDYDSSTQPYAGNGQSANSVIKERTNWSKQTKQKTEFSINPAANDNEYLYNDASIAYNTTRTYNGIVIGESFITKKPKTEWSN